MTCVPFALTGFGLSASLCARRQSARPTNSGLWLLQALYCRSAHTPRLCPPPVRCYVFLRYHFVTSDLDCSCVNTVETCPESWSEWAAAQPRNHEGRRPSLSSLPSTAEICACIWSAFDTLHTGEKCRRAHTEAELQKLCLNSDTLKDAGTRRNTHVCRSALVEARAPTQLLSSKDILRQAIAHLALNRTPARCLAYGPHPRTPTPALTHLRQKKPPLAFLGQ